jgi:hypothetical protein
MRWRKGVMTLLLKVGEHSPTPEGLPFTCACQFTVQNEKRGGCLALAGHRVSGLVQLKVGVANDGLFCVVRVKFDIAYKKIRFESRKFPYLVRPNWKLQTRHSCVAAS